MTITKRSIFFSGIILLIILLILFSEKSEAATLTKWNITNEVSTNLTHNFSEYKENLFNVTDDYFHYGPKDYFMAADKGKLYCVENIWAENKEERTSIQAQRLQIYDCNTKEISTTYYYDNIFVDDFFVSDGTIIFFYQEPILSKGFEYDKSVQADKFSNKVCASIAKEDGTLLKGVELTSLYTSLKGPVKDGKIYYEGATGRFIAIGEDGKIAVSNRFCTWASVFSDYKNQKVQFLFETNDGRLVFKSSGSGSTSTIFYIDTDNIKEIQDVSFYFSKVFQSPGGEIVYRTYPDESFVKWNIDSGERDKFLSFNQSYIKNSYVAMNDAGEVFVLKDGNLRVFSQNAKEPVTVTVQKYAQWDPNIDKVLQEYEMTHPNVKFEFVSFGNKEDDEEIRFQTTVKAISEGKGADIISIREDSFDTFYEAGCVRDISDYLSEEEKDNMFTAFLDASGKDGKLYKYPSFYTRKTLGAKKGTFAADSYTATELLLLLEKREKEGKPYKALCYGDEIINPFDIFSYAMDESEFIDWNEGICSFDSDIFIRILKQCNKYYSDKAKSPALEKERAEALLNDEALFVLIDSMTLGEFEKYKSACGDKFTIVGFPTTAKSGNTTAYHRALIINKKTKNYDIIKDFLNCLCKNYWGETGLHDIPVSKDYYDELVVEGRESNSDIFEIRPTGYVELTEGYKEAIMAVAAPSPALILGKNSMFPLTKKEDGTSYINEFIAYYDSIRLTDKRFEPIWDIMNEEVDKMYKQNISEKETAKNIQKKVSEYLNNLQ